VADLCANAVMWIEEQQRREEMSARATKEIK
jgi:hypothetical protein